MRVNVRVVVALLFVSLSAAADAPTPSPPAPKRVVRTPSAATRRPVLQATSYLSVTDKLLLRTKALVWFAPPPPWNVEAKIASELRWEGLKAQSAAVYALDFGETAWREDLKEIDAATSGVRTSLSRLEGYLDALKGKKHEAISTGQNVVVSLISKECGSTTPAVTANYKVTYSRPLPCTFALRTSLTLRELDDELKRVQRVIQNLTSKERSDQDAAAEAERREQAILDNLEAAAAALGASSSGVAP